MLVLLLTDGFGGSGGISKFNRDFMQALDASSVVERLYMFPRLVTHPIEEPIPESVVYDRKAAGGNFAFLRRVLWYAWCGSKPYLVICGHLNLLPAAWLLARLRDARLALIIHGIEAWKRRSWLYGTMLKSVDSFIAVSRYSAERFADWSNVSKKKFFILPNCVDLNLFVPEARGREKLVERYGVRDLILYSRAVLAEIGHLQIQNRPLIRTG